MVQVAASWKRSWMRPALEAPASSRCGFLGPNTAAREFCSTCGFEIVGTCEAFLLDGRYVDDVLMAGHLLKENQPPPREPKDPPVGWC